MKTGISDVAAMLRSALLLALITAAVSLFLYPSLLSGAFAVDAMPRSLSTDTAATDGADQPTSAGTTSTGAGETTQYRLLPALIVVLFWIFVVVGAALFVWMFLGDATRKKVDLMFRYCYAIAAFVVFFSLTLVFFLRVPSSRLLVEFAPRLFEAQL